ncbi:MAG: helix-turn-helix domain-containing protein [Oscillospiraceae bacterium]|nr:helix-turn-helix domain-containing protein [Oscillospiraceae bacterium]
MELNSQIKKYRSKMNWSQEELAEKVYVSRQTISNWENGKSYPDIHSIVLLGAVFNVSLDELIKGDVEIMRNEIKTEDVKELKHCSTAMFVLMVIIAASAVPLMEMIGMWTLAVEAVLFAVCMYFSIRAEKIKKKNDISTYKEIVAFMDGQYLDEITKEHEKAVRPYQNFIKALCAGAAAIVVCAFIGLLMGLFK